MKTFGDGNNEWYMIIRLDDLDYCGVDLSGSNIDYSYSVDYIIYRNNDSQITKNDIKYLKQALKKHYDDQRHITIISWKPIYPASLSESCLELIEKEGYEKRPTKEKCEYCGGITFDDSRGSCMACGAPREQSTKPMQKPFGITIRRLTA